jgi:hypothetical protein
MTSALERLDGHIEEVEDYLSSLREQRKALLLVDQSVARLASLNADISTHQELLAGLKQVVAEAFASMNRRAA